MGALTKPDVANSLFPLASSAISCLQCLEPSGSQYLHHATQIIEVCFMAIEDEASHVSLNGNRKICQGTCATQSYNALPKKELYLSWCICNISTGNNKLPSNSPTC